MTKVQHSTSAKCQSIIAQAYASTLMLQKELKRSLTNTVSHSQSQSYMKQAHGDVWVIVE